MRAACWLLALTALSGCRAARADCAGPGQCRPPLVARALGGQALDEDSLSGRVVVLNLWATWCKPCEQELPALEAVYRRHRDQGVVFVGVVTADRGSDEQVLRFAAARGVSYPLLRSTPDLERQIGAAMLPMTYVYDGRGRLRQVFRGAIDAAILSATLNGVLGG